MSDRPPEEGIYGVESSPEDARVILIPVPWEATTSYGRGTASGPAAIAEASVQVDLFDLALARLGLPDPSAQGIALLPVDPDIAKAAEEASEVALRVIAAYHAGAPASPSDPDRVRVNQLSALLNERVAELAERWHTRGRVVGVVGGDHSVPYGAIATAARRFPGLGVLHVDAHADLRVAYQGFEHSHASIMHNVAALDDVARIVSVGVRDLSVEEHEAAAASSGKILPFYDAENAGRLQAGTPWQTICDEVAEALPPDVYVSFDIDGLEPALCPHTGTPVPGGLSFHQATGLLAAVVSAGRRIVGFDLCEVAPSPQADDEWDANVGARILYKLVGYALASQRASAK